MAADPVVTARLGEAHRLAQHRLGVGLVTQMLATWALLDLADLDHTVEGWVAVNVALIAAQRRRSAQLAAGYLTAARQLAVGPSTWTPTVADTLNRAAAATSLTVTGPVRIKTGVANGGLPMNQVVDHARASSTAAGMRHALDGGRDTITESVAGDRLAVGWARQTSGEPCAWCAMQASRGPVFKSRETAELNRDTAFKPHDGCACNVVPVYDVDAPWPPGSRQYRDLWNSSTSGEADQLNAFRRALAAQRREAAAAAA